MGQPAENVAPCGANHAGDCTIACSERRAMESLRAAGAWPMSKPSADDDAAFYEKHYSDWIVHELPLMILVPTTKGVSRVEAVELVREVLDEAAFDIRVRVIPPALGA